MQPFTLLKEQEGIQDIAVGFKDEKASTSGTIPKSRYWRGLGKLAENSNSTFRRFQVLKSSKLAELRKKVKLPCFTDHPVYTGDKV